MISLGRHLGSLLLGAATSALLLGGLAVAAPVDGPAADLAGALGVAVRSAAVLDAGPSAADRNTVAAPTSRLRTVPRAVVAAVPTTPPAASPGTAAAPTAAPSTAATPSSPRRAAAPATPVERPKQVSAHQISAPKRKSGGGPAAVVEATNAERAEAGCGPLRSDSRLNAAAQDHASDMAAKDYFSHTDRNGGSSEDRIRDAGYTGSSTGENIAYGQDTASEVVADWMGSSGHRRNILDCSYDRIGVGYDSRGDYWVQTFGG